MIAIDDKGRLKKCPYIKLPCQDTNVDTFRGNTLASTGFGQASGSPVNQLTESQLLKKIEVGRCSLAIGDIQLI